MVLLLDHIGLRLPHLLVYYYFTHYTILVVAHTTFPYPRLPYP